MTELTPLVVATWILALHLRSPLVAVAAGGMMPTGAFLIFGTVALPTVYASAIFALVASMLLGRGDSGSGVRHEGIVLLWLFALWSAAVTLVAPFLFEGAVVIALGGSERPLSPQTFLTSSNTAQLLYLFLGVAVAAIAARAPRQVVWLVFVTLTGIALLSLWRYLGLNAGLPYPFGYFDNSPGFRYIDGAPGGFVRFRGIFSEPAGLAVSSLASIAMGASLLAREHGRRMVLVLVGIAAAAINLSQSTSATGQVAAAVLLGLGIATSLASFLILKRRWRLGTVLVWIVGAALSIWLVPVLVDYVSTIVGGKVGTFSYDERSGADAYSFQLLLDTWGVGVGVGSNRPSSFLASIAAATGVVGTVLFFSVVVVAMVRALRVPAMRSLIWCLAAVLLAKLVSSPDLSDTSGVMWLAIGGLVGGGARGEDERLAGMWSPPAARKTTGQAAIRSG